ncbi:putative baseplate assembly protein [Paraburkholderia dipogonis]|uniref:putative baseplate assembly protein n=1 Tax=Paraburkholderia dipogonis TaxID=1211383 RepID=UPI0038BC9C2C
MTDTTNSATCGCCAGVTVLTPVDALNPPGQTVLHFRVGTQARFMESQLARLAAPVELQALTTRDRGDPALALLDAWSSVLDVLSFYEERIVNEGFLRTATERRSVLELARGIGYELRPGVAASTFLAITLETAPGAPPEARVDAGTKAQSVPAQGEQPQVFETVEDLQARAAWNALEVVHDEAAPPHWGGATLYLQGQSTRLSPGDPLLVIGDERRLQPGSEQWDFRRVGRVQVVPPAQPSGDPQAGTTVVTLDRPLGSVAPHVDPALSAPRCYALRTKAALFGQAAAAWRAMPRSLRAAFLSIDNVDDHAVDIAKVNEWPDFTVEGVSGAKDTVLLDASYPKIVRGGWVVLSTPAYDEVFKVTQVREDGCTAFGLSGKSTRLTLSGEGLSEHFNNQLRSTSVYGESVELAWATRPRSGFIDGHVLTLAGSEPDLTAGRWLALSGHILADVLDNGDVRRRLRAADHLAAVELARDEASAAITFTDGERMTATLQRASEVVQLTRNDVIGGRSQLTLSADLLHAYLPVTLRINANVVAATHGDSKQMKIRPEVLGSGNGSAAFQRFQLQQKPLTYVSAPTPSGTQAALDVRVDGVLWHEAARITELGPNDSEYLLRRADDGTVTLTFGDGMRGRRLPSGQMNVQARYRVGIGAAGNLKAGQISMLLERALGVKDVVNPVPATGGADPEVLADARRNAPLTMLALDRIVSLRDFEDYAAAFAGVGKAQAVWLWDGEQRLVHLTVVGLDGADIEAGSDLFRNLLASIDNVRPAHQALRMESGEVLRFGLTARLRILPDYAGDKVLPAVRAALSDAFGFLQRGYGQSLSGSEALSVIQRVPGIERVDLDVLRSHPGGSVAGPDGRLRARGGRWQGAQIRPAQLLLIDPADVVLTELSS